METEFASIFVWPTGDWCYAQELNWRIDEGSTEIRIPAYWSEDRIDRYVQANLKQLFKEPK